MLSSAKYAGMEVSMMRRYRPVNTDTASGCLMASSNASPLSHTGTVNTVANTMHTMNPRCTTTPTLRNCRAPYA